MTDQPEGPQLYLIAPTGPASALAERLTPVLDALPVACLRLPAPATADEAELGRLADIARDLAHARDIAVVIDDHITLAQRHGLDGVHLTNGPKNIRYARKELGADAIVGAFCGQSRHDGINAAEAGADYVSFGPVGKTALGTGETADTDLFQWWSDMIETPVVAEGSLDATSISRLKPITDFIAIGPEIWTSDDPVAALRAFFFT
ncbi:MAG: thiamine phosphate synthase [Paracoccus sp. (in: a-proteobacteria)]|uniref:thiamine phosphate synthase n=1 Tax=Paracoccus sp. TaxID=267 RepID=UPI0026DF767A|nr:thiamine phosphate synthase [Paracoccus sp. (in: a-proteobacteria)]MDO5622412.1 thiamine phosphate synthase [Paracoccus sp. (in: a-proteobacteria)]